MTLFHSILLILIIHQNFAQNDNLKDEGRYILDMQHCGCKRKIKKPSFDKIVSFNQTTCSLDAYNRGLGQKIIGFSLYGNHTDKLIKFRGYVEGITGNLELMSKFYPGWIMRLYTDYGIEEEIFLKLCDIACQYSNIDICLVKDLPGTPFLDASKIFPMNWRFFPTMDPQVDVYLSRDLDSRINDREHAAVQEWLKYNKSIHVMRDHINHDFSMLGGCWGTKLIDSNIRLQWIRTWKYALLDDLMYAHHDSWGPDQDLLEKYVWPWAEDDSLGHDSYYCLKYNNTKSFPTKRNIGVNNFVAAIPHLKLIAFDSYEMCHPENEHSCSSMC